MRNNRLVALSLTALGVFAWMESERYGALSRLFPQVVAVALVVLSMVLLAQTFTAHARRAEALRREGHARAEKPDLRGVGLSVLIMIAWTLLLEPLGFWTASLLAFALLVVTLRTEDQSAMAVWKTVLAGVVLMTAFVLVFRIMLRVPLPTGLFW